MTRQRVDERRRYLRLRDAVQCRELAQHENGDQPMPTIGTESTLIVGSQCTSMLQPSFSQRGGTVGAGFGALLQGVIENTVP